MRKSIFLFVMLFISFESFGQLDSLQLQLSESTTWKERVNAHVDLASYFSSKDSSRVMQHVNAIKRIAQEQNDDKAWSQAYTALATYHTKTSNYDAAQNALSKAYLFTVKMEDPESTSSILGNMGVLKYYTNDLDSAKYYLDTSYQIKKTIPNIDSSNLSRNLNSLALISRELRLMEDAIGYQKEALKIGEASGNNSTYLRALNGLAGLYLDLDEIDKAFETRKLLYKKAIQFSDFEAVGVAARNIGMKYFDDDELDSAKHYFKISEEHFNKIGYKRGLVEVNMSFGDLSFAKNEFIESIKYFTKGKRLATEIKDERLLWAIALQLSENYLIQEQIQNAKPEIQDILGYLERNDFTFQKKKSFDVLTKYYKSTKDFENAFKYQEKYFLFTDSLNKETFNDDVKSLQLEFENELQEIKIEKQKLSIANLKAKEDVLYRNTGIAALLGLSLILIAYQRFQKNKIVARKNLALKNQKIKELKSENKLLAMASMIEGQESERKRIAQDLHDGLGGIISTIKLQMKKVQKEIKVLSDMKLFAKTESLIESAYSEVRRISHDMMPGALINLGLFAAVEDLADEINEINELKIRAQWYTSDSKLSEKAKVILFRIIQEVVTNCLKYAEAKNLIIQMSENEGYYNLTIEDDGVGFDYEKEYKKSLGIKNIKSRVEYLNGELEIITAKNEGTTYEITIPHI